MMVEVEDRFRDKVCFEGDERVGMGSLVYILEKGGSRDDSSCVLIDPDEEERIAAFFGERIAKRGELDGGLKFISEASKRVRCLPPSEKVQKVQRLLDTGVAVCGYFKNEIDKLRGQLKEEREQAYDLGMAEDLKADKQAEEVKQLEERFSVLEGRNQNLSAACRVLKMEQESLTEANISLTAECDRLREECERIDRFADSNRRTTLRNFELLRDKLNLKDEVAQLQKEVRSLRAQRDAQLMRGDAHHRDALRLSEEKELLEKENTKLMEDAMNRAGQQENLANHLASKVAISLFRMAGTDLPAATNEGTLGGLTVRTEYGFLRKLLQGLEDKKREMPKSDAPKQKD